MRAVFIFLLVGGAAVSLPACRSQQDQNIVMDNGADPNAQVEALPPDESTQTPSNELVNGSDNPAVDGRNSASNAD